MRRPDRRGVMLLAALTPLAGCAPAPAAPAPAILRAAPPPWPAPRDAISHIAAAGLPALPLDAPVRVRARSTLAVTYDGRPADLPAYVGIDRVRALQAPVHTHDGSGAVHVESPDPVAATVGQVFALWGVRLDERCLADRCGQVRVSVDGQPVPGDPRAVPLRDGASVRVEG